jgi:hypothetical protein
MAQTQERGRLAYISLTRFDPDGLSGILGECDRSDNKSYVVNVGVI